MIEAILAAALPFLTPDGLGAVKIGMTRAQVERALHVRLEGEAIQDANSCIEMDARAYPGLYFMFERRQLTRISVTKPSRIVTPRGIGIGARAADVRRSYGRSLVAEPHHYEASPAEYLTYWTVLGKRGVEFETEAHRRVRVIHAGTSSIGYVEGCA